MIVSHHRFIKNLYYNPKWAREGEVNTDANKRNSGVLSCGGGIQAG